MNKTGYVKELHSQHFIFVVTYKRDQ
jgi:hypothetical protein